MKYYTKELWGNVNNENEEIRIDADKQWIDNSNCYSIVYNEVKNKLQKRFINIYEKELGFHDWKVKALNINQKFIKRKSIMEVEIIITKDLKIYQISFIGIEKINIEYGKDFSICEGFGDWGYSEILTNEDKTISFEILFSSGATFLIHFKKISIEKLNNIN